MLTYRSLNRGVDGGLEVEIGPRHRIVIATQIRICSFLAHSAVDDNYAITHCIVLRLNSLPKARMGRISPVLTWSARP